MPVLRVCFSEKHKVTHIIELLLVYICFLSKRKISLYWNNIKNTQLKNLKRPSEAEGTFTNPRILIGLPK